MYLWVYMFIDLIVIDLRRYSIGIVCCFIHRKMMILCRCVCVCVCPSVCVCVSGYRSHPLAHCVCLSLSLFVFIFSRRLIFYFLFSRSCKRKDWCCCIQNKKTTKKQRPWLFVAFKLNPITQEGARENKRKETGVKARAKKERGEGKGEKKELLCLFIFLPTIIVFGFVLP